MLVHLNLCRRCLKSLSHQPLRFSSHYTVLGVSKSATHKEIRDAYITLSKKHHPDQNTTGQSQEAAHNKIVKINEAYSVLSKSQSRREYDVSQLYSPGSQGPSGPYANSGQYYQYYNQQSGHSEHYKKSKFYSRNSDYYNRYPNDDEYGNPHYGWQNNNQQGGQQRNNRRQGDPFLVPKVVGMVQLFVLFKLLFYFANENKTDESKKQREQESIKYQKFHPSLNKEHGPIIYYGKKGQQTPQSEYGQRAEQRPQSKYGRAQQRLQSEYGQAQQRPKSEYGQAQQRPQSEYGQAQAKPRSEYGRAQAKPRSEYGQRAQTKPESEYGPEADYGQRNQNRPISEIRQRDQYRP